MASPRPTAVPNTSPASASASDRTPASTINRGPTSDSSARVPQNGMTALVSIGTGVPFRNWLGTIDMSLSYAWIGSIEDNGYESEALRLGVSISGLERLIF